jgi:hypothetical protein
MNLHAGEQQEHPARAVAIRIGQSPGISHLQRCPLKLKERSSHLRDLITPCVMSTIDGPDQPSSNLGMAVQIEYP